MASDDSGHKPTWLPDWVPEHNTLKFSVTCLQLLIMGLAAGFLLFHLMKRNTGTAVGILGNQAT